MKSPNSKYFWGAPEGTSCQFSDYLQLSQGVCRFHLLLLLQPPPSDILHLWDASTILLWTIAPTVPFFASWHSALGYLRILWTLWSTRDFCRHTRESESQRCIVFYAKVGESSLLSCAMLLGRLQISSAFLLTPWEEI